MKSNMSSLTKKLIFFLIFSILSNFATSDEAIEDCRCNINEVFIVYYGITMDNFAMAMTALSENLITLDFLSENEDNLYGYYKQYDVAIENINNEIFSSKHKNVLQYFETHNNYKEYRNKNTLAAKLSDIMGYFRSFVDKIDNPDYSDISSRINQIIMTPQEFCRQAPAPGVFAGVSSRVSPAPGVLSSGVYIDTCDKALRIMLDVRDDDETEMTGSKAFKYCYLNYTYLDFTTNHLSSSQAGSSGGSLQSRLNQDELSKKWYIKVMIKYFSYLLQQTNAIGEYYKNEDRRLFVTPYVYCESEVKKGRQNQTPN